MSQAISNRQATGRGLPLAIRWALALQVALLAGCQSVPPSPSSSTGIESHWSSNWEGYALPGKSNTHYVPTRFDGHAVVHATSKASASMLRRPVSVEVTDHTAISFSWRVASLVPGASTSQRDLEDAPARIVLAFNGDHGTLPARTRMMFDLAYALTGEQPPYATLMYVWDGDAPVNTVIVNPRSDRVRKIVVESGAENLNRWRSYRRNLRSDFIRAFGEDPGLLQGVALMTDSDNTRSRAEAYYGEVVVHSEEVETR